MLLANSDLTFFTVIQYPPQSFRLEICGQIPKKWLPSRLALACLSSSVTAINGGKEKPITASLISCAKTAFPFASFQSISYRTKLIPKKSAKARGLSSDPLYLLFGLLSSFYLRYIDLLRSPHQLYAGHHR